MSQRDGLIDIGHGSGAARRMRPAITIVIGMSTTLIMIVPSILGCLMVDVRNACLDVRVMGVQLRGLVSNQGQESENAEPKHTHED